MVDKIIISPSKVRAYGNILGVKDDDDYEVVDCTITESTATINGISMGVYLMEPDLGEATSLTVTSSSIVALTKTVLRVWHRWYFSTTSP